MTGVTTAGEPAGPEAERLAELRSSARGWHGIQLAVIGFVGLCGVLKGEGSGAPEWVQALAGYLALAALALACIATYQVGRAAWPLYDVRRAAPPVSEELLRTSRRITTGLVLTFTAVALIALAGLSSWWPVDDEADGAHGGGEAVSWRPAGDPSAARSRRRSQARSPSSRAASGSTVPIARLTALRPVDGC